MATTRGSKVLWSDITAIYSKLNQVRNKFAFSGTVYPNGGGQNNYATAATWNSLRSEIATLNTNSQISSSNKLPTPAQVNRGTLITANSILSQLTDVYDNVCSFSCFSSFDYGGGGSSEFSTCNWDFTYSCGCDFGPSSRNLKHNIHSTEINALDKINEIKLVDFIYNDGVDKIDKDKPKIGFIAEDTNTIFTNKDHNKIDYYNCIGVILKAIQELSLEIKNIKEQQND